MECDSCGAELNDHPSRCPACGAVVAGVPTATLPPPTIEARAGAPEEIVINAADPVDLDEELFAAPAPVPPPLPDLPAPTASAADETTVATAVGTATTTLDAPIGPPTTVVTPAATVFDGHADIAEHPPERDGFKVRLVFVFAFFAAVAAALVPAANIIDIRTTRPVDGIAIGAVQLDDMGTNLAVASFVGVGVMVLGGLIACWGFRWAAGLAGGAGLALIGWAALVIGLVEARIEVAEEVTRTSAVGFTLEVTRDLGYWLIVAVAAVGLLVFVAALRLARTGGRPGFNPWIAAVGAVAALVLAVGPLLPVNGASFGDNFWIANDGDAFSDYFRLANDDVLPLAFFTGRLGQVALIGIFGAIGFLLVRWFGLGLAAGAVSVATWMWFSSLAELGDDPVGIAWRNPGATDTTPHAVTSVGMVLTLVMLLAAAIAAAVQHRRVYHR